MESDDRRSGHGPVSRPGHKKFLALATALAAVSVAYGGVARADEEPDRRPLIVVTGESEVRATPDRAWVTLAVESRDKDPKAAQKQNATTMAAVYARLEGAGIAREAVRTLAYDLDLEVDWDKGRRIPRGYVARNTIEVRVDQIDRVGEIIDLSVGAGANDVTGVRFDLKERAALERQALQQAVADARARADAAAAGAGVSVDRVQRVEQEAGFAPSPRPYAAEMRMATAEAAAPKTTISGGEIEIRSRVRLSVSIK